MTALAAHLNLENHVLVVTLQAGLELEHLQQPVLDNFSAIITAPQDRTGLPKVGSETRFLKIYCKQFKYNNLKQSTEF